MRNEYSEAGLSVVDAKNIGSSENPKYLDHRRTAGVGGGGGGGRVMVFG